MPITTAANMTANQIGARRTAALAGGGVLPRGFTSVPVAPPPPGPMTGGPMPPPPGGGMMGAYGTGRGAVRPAAPGGSMAARMGAQQAGALGGAMGGGALGGMGGAMGGALGGMGGMGAPPTDRLSAIHHLQQMYGGFGALPQGYPSRNQPGGIALGYPGAEHYSFMTRGGSDGAGAQR